MGSASDEVVAAKPGSLKTQNIPTLRALLIINAVLCVSIIFGLAIGFHDITARADVIIDSALLMVVASLATYILTEFLSDDTKAILVFLRVSNPLPGCRAFSNYAVTDPRVDPAVLQKKWGELPTDPIEQNRLWYKMLKKQEKMNAHILENHRVFLLLRDSAALALILTTLVALALPFVGTAIGRPWWLLGVLFLEFLGASAAARSVGISLVRNVMAEESLE